MTSTATFPLAPEDVTAAWLTDALRACGAIRAATVTSFARERVGEGVGFLGQLARITPQYDITEATAPATLIGKFPAPVESAREMAALYGLYRCEVNFYQQIASRVAARIPRCYFAAVNDAGTEFALLLEDLGAAGTIGDQVAGCPLEHARLALREIARLHAGWWQHPDLDTLTWMPLGSELFDISMLQAYPAGWEACLRLYGDKLDKTIVDAAPGMNERLMRLFADRADLPLTLMHADFRLDNMFFGTKIADYDLAIIDWQIANRGWAAYDVAYFMSGNLDMETRRAHEDNLLRTYHDELCARGVDGYSLATLHLHYRESVLAYMANMIGNAASLDTANERGVELFDMMLSRISAAVVDLDALSLLSD